MSDNPPKSRTARTPPSRQRADLAVSIADQLGRRIARGTYPPGGTLPSEIELAAAFGVSRSAMREAFRLLAGTGVVARSRRIGTRVSPRNAWNMLDPAVLGWHIEAVPTDAFVTGLFETRFIVEPEAAALAAERRDAAGLARIDEAFAAMQLLAGRADPLVTADLQFHQAILNAAANPFLASFGAVIRSSLTASFRLSWAVGARTPGHALERHGAVLEAIRAGQGGASREAMAMLLREAIADVRRGLALRDAEGGGHAGEDPCRTGGPTMQTQSGRAACARTKRR